MPDYRISKTGPHSPKTTMEAGAAFADAVQALVYATLGDAPGLASPADAFDLLSWLYMGTGALPQLLDQAGAFLEAQAAAGILADSAGGDPALLTLTASQRLAEAASAIQAATRQLHAAQNAISGLRRKDHTRDTPGG
jgi:hypothetical protein